MAVAMATRAFKLTQPRPLERSEQESLFQWAAFHAAKDARLNLLNASLNGVRLSAHQAVLAKRSGMKRGYPDIFLPVPATGWSGLFIELKRVGGVPSDVKPEQAWWLAALRDQGYCTRVCYGWQHAAQDIMAYLGNGHEES